MGTNKIDRNIKEKFESRTFAPSASAWERLSVQLEEQPKQKKLGWFFYIGVAASVLLLVSIGIQLFTDESNENYKKEEVVITPIQKNEIENKIEEFKNLTPVEEVIVKKNRVEVEKDLKTSVISKKVKTPIFDKKVITSKTNTDKDLKIAENNNIQDKVIIPEIDEIKKSSIDKILKQDPNSTIKINADDLLYAVTHSEKEVQAYYAKYQINREDVLKTIKGELKKSNIKINPNRKISRKLSE